MGKNTSKCRGVGELAVMEVAPVVGVRTRARTLALASAASVTSPKRTKMDQEASQEGVLHTSYLQLRSRSVVKTTRRARTPRNMPVVHGISRCSSNESGELAFEGCGAKENSPSHVNETSRERRESNASSEIQSEAGDLESTAGDKSRKRKRTMTESTVMMPTEAEIEEFFAAAEREEKQRFTDKYNYDVINDVPLDGRYQWIRVNP